mgnify:CR=1 FL=1
MVRVVFLIVALSFSSVSWAGKCGTATDISHSGSTAKEFELCIDFEKAGDCEYPRTIKVQPEEIVKVSFTFMCGYPSDPGIDKYWLIYREAGKSKYSITKYSERGVVL